MSSPYDTSLFPLALPVRSITSSVHFTMRYPMCSVLIYSVVFTRAISVPSYTLLAFPWRSLVPPYSQLSNKPWAEAQPWLKRNAGLTPNSLHNLACVPPSSLYVRVSVPRGLLCAFSRTFPVRSQRISLAFPCIACPFCQAFRRVFQCVPWSVPPFLLVTIRASSLGFLRSSRTLFLTLALTLEIARISLTPPPQVSPFTFISSPTEICSRNSVFVSRASCSH